MFWFSLESIIEIDLNYFLPAIFRWSRIQIFPDFPQHKVLNFYYKNTKYNMKRVLFWIVYCSGTKIEFEYFHGFKPLQFHCNFQCKTRPKVFLSMLTPAPLCSCPRQALRRLQKQRELSFSLSCIAQRLPLSNFLLSKITQCLFESTSGPWPLAEPRLYIKAFRWIKTRRVTQSLERES